MCTVKCQPDVVKVYATVSFNSRFPTPVKKIVADLLHTEHNYIIIEYVSMFNFKVVVPIVVYL